MIFVWKYLNGFLSKWISYDNFIWKIYLIANFIMPIKSNVCSMISILKFFTTCWEDSQMPNLIFCHKWKKPLLTPPQFTNMVNPFQDEAVLSFHISFSMVNIVQIIFVTKSFLFIFYIQETTEFSNANGIRIWNNNFIFNFIDFMILISSSNVYKISLNDIIKNLL